MAGKKKEDKMYKITVKSNPKYCGIDAGGVPDGRMVEWFNEHEGYHVAEIEQNTQTDSAE